MHDMIYTFISEQANLGSDMFVFEALLITNLNILGGNSPPNSFEINNVHVHNGYMIVYHCQDINMANSNVMVLNGRTATAVALVLFNFASGAIQGSDTLPMI